MSAATTHHARLALRRAASRARIAPSIHNTQPWHLRLDGDTLEMEIDPGRRLGTLDPAGRQAWISCGCALFNARVSLAGEDTGCVITRFPDGVDSPLFARLRLVPLQAQAAPAQAERDALIALDVTVPARHTNRSRFTHEPVSEGFITRLSEAAAAEGAILTAVRRPEHRDAVARLTSRADSIQYADPAYRAELRAWTTDDPFRPDGVQAGAVPHVDGTSSDEIPLRDFDMRGSGKLPADTHSTRDQTMVLIGSTCEGPRDWLQTGEALERVLLEITRYGHVASPLMQALEVPVTRAELRRELGVPYYPQFLLRVGTAAPTPPTPRRPLEDVLDESSS